MSPILVRPVREQLEHDRVIRLLQAKYKRKYDVAINPGHEQTASVAGGVVPWYPDLVLQSADRRRRLLGTVEVETAESVNSLEAMSQWATFSRFRAPFHLYVPVSSVDTAKRLCAVLQISVSEIWAYNALADQILFTLVHRSTTGKRRSTAAARTAPAKRPAGASRAGSRRKAAGKNGAQRGAKSVWKRVAKAAGKKRVAPAAGATKATRATRSRSPARGARVAKAATSTKATASAKGAKVAKAAKSIKKASRSSGPKKRR